MHKMRERIDAALRDAVKAQDRRRTCTLRLINAALKDRDIAARAQGRDRVGDEEVLQILVKMMKQREESVRTYEQAGRLELADQEREESEIIRSFMPQQLCDAEIRNACENTVGEIGANGLKDIGRTMNVLKERFSGQMDFSKASRVVKDILAGAR
jgi:uncharacterized protein YqeY